MFRIRPVAPEAGHFLLQNMERSFAQLWDRRRRFCFRCPVISNCIFNQLMHWRKFACRIRCGRIASYQERLAAASAEIFFTAVAGAAGFGHPFFATKFLECLRVLPYPIDPVLAYAVETHAGNHSGRVAGQGAAGGIDEQQLPSPPAHASFRKACIVVGHNHVDADPALQSFLGCRDCG